MIVQFEDCIDCLTVVYNDEYDFVFLFDHSSGHAKKRVNGLDAAGMNKSHGGTRQHPTLIKQKEGYLGPFHNPQNARMVQVGEEQSLNWDGDLGDDDGPWYLTSEERRKQREDELVPLAPNKVKDVEKKKRALIEEILQADTARLLSRQVLEKKTLTPLQEIAKKLDIEIAKVVTHRLKTGYRSKGKGYAQVLWERGWIDENLWSEYRIRREDSDGKLIPGMSLQHLMESCTDFANEVSQLEYVGQCLGVRVIITTKYHAEYAGEGVEYSWGFSKCVYRRNPLSAKKGKINFDALVNKCISREVISVDMVRKFSKRARGYMLAYRALESDEMTEEPTEITHKMIEKMKKVISSHRAALDFDRGFLNKVITAEGFDLVAEVKSEKKGLSKVGKKRKQSSISSFAKKKKGN